ncbi:two-component sensor histidine kinase [Amycolatopsis antarctica]|uniref:histidine kinase n=1 Tax=Amycolatopsis antarctica TaxID=1854586 RepID=A0A263D900_9PSEU|nr:two-component sensor histidine kinase [Amycolatopsis antarctica]
MRHRTPAVQDVAVTLTTFAGGCLLYLTGIFPIGAANPDIPVWPRVAVFATACALELLRRRSPATALCLSVLPVAADIAMGLSIPVLIVLSDLLYAATLYGSRRLNRAMIPLVSVITIGATIVTLVLIPDWRGAIVAAVIALPFLITPVWWAANVRQHQEIAATERANAGQLAKIAALDREAAVAGERARMARDLHDVIAGHLSAIAIQSEALLAHTDSDPATVRRVVRSVRSNSVDALEEMRMMIGLLTRGNGTEEAAATTPPRLSELSKIVESARASGMVVDVHTELESMLPLPAAVDLTAYRIAQEALTNAVKHAPGGRASLTVRRVEDRLTVEVTNELPGGRTQADEQGAGLLNMRERARAIGGSLTAGPCETTWRVSAVLPVTAAR